VAVCCSNDFSFSYSFRSTIYSIPFYSPSLFSWYFCFNFCRCCGLGIFCWGSFPSTHFFPFSYTYIVLTLWSLFLLFLVFCVLWFLISPCFVFFCSPLIPRWPWLYCRTTPPIGLHTFLQFVSVWFSWSGWDVPPQSSRDCWQWR